VIVSIADCCLFVAAADSVITRPNSADSRGFGTRFVKFSNGPNTISECSNLLYLLTTRYPKNFKNDVMSYFWWVYSQDFSGFSTCFDEGIQCKKQALFLGRSNGLIRCQYNIIRVLLKTNDQNIPFGCAKYCYVHCTNKMPCFAFYFELCF
jgi:hypothetical protein